MLFHLSKYILTRPQPGRELACTLLTAAPASIIAVAAAHSTHALVAPVLGASVAGTAFLVAFMATGFGTTATMSRLFDAVWPPLGR